jgi:hypothetical protein
LSEKKKRVKKEAAMGRMEDSQRGSSEVGSAIVLTVVLTVLIGGTVHYSLKRHDQGQAIQLMRQAQQAGESEAVALSRAFSSFGGILVQTDLFRLQEMFATGFGQEGFVDGVVVDQDNMIVAAKNQALIGKQIQDGAWPSLRAQNKELVSREQDHSGRVLVTVIQPMKDKKETIAWAKMTYAIPQPAQAMRLSKDRLKETAKLVGPLAAALLIGMIVVMRSAAARVRKQIQSVVSSAQGGESGSHSGSRLRKVS